MILGDIWVWHFQIVAFDPEFDFRSTSIWFHKHNNFLPLRGWGIIIKLKACKHVHVRCPNSFCCLICTNTCTVCNRPFPFSLMLHMKMKFSPYLYICINISCNMCNFHQYFLVYSISFTPCNCWQYLENET